MAGSLGWRPGPSIGKATRQLESGSSVCNRVVLIGGLVGMASLLMSCGWRPLYAPAASGSAGVAQAGLAEIAVPIIPERPGQLFRLALQTRFERQGSDRPRRYDLSVVLRLSSEPIAILQANLSTRVRVVGSAEWSLVGRGGTPRTVTSGTARSVDGYDVINQQFFASDLQNDEVQRRVVEALADQITQELASYLAGVAPPL